MVISAVSLLLGKNTLPAWFVYAAPVVTIPLPLPNAKKLTWPVVGVVPNPIKLPPTKF